MLAPKNLKVGDVFTDNYGVSWKITEIVDRIGYNAVKVSKEITQTNVKTDSEKTPSDNLEDKGIKELQAMCKEKGLSIRGTKADVIERLRSN